jgi:hypothetical protein
MSLIAASVNSRADNMGEYSILVADNMGEYTILVAENMSEFYFELQIIWMNIKCRLPKILTNIILSCGKCGRISFGIKLLSEYGDNTAASSGPYNSYYI